MKNLYLIVFFLFFTKTFSQQDLQNANWVFGDDLLLNFDDNGVQNQIGFPPHIFDSPEGIASVSDINGDLLFWTDGENVFWLNGTNIEIYNSVEPLFGNGSSFQNIVITPRPNWPGRYYIFYISGYTSVVSNQSTGLYWAEVDTVNHIILTPNSILEDTNGTPINQGYGNVCEGLTTAPAANGDYWLIAHVQNDANSFIYSYRIAENGINRESEFPFVNDLDNPTLAIKVSSNLDRIAISRDRANPVLLNFDNANGVLSNLVEVGAPSTEYFNGIEFSPASNNLFYKRGTELMVVSITNPTIEFTVNSTIQSAGAIQRAIDGRLYVARKGEGFLSVINDPNSTNLNNVGFVENFQLVRQCLTGLPQWVWQNCNQTLISNIVPLNNMIEEERLDWIRTTDLITFGNGVIGDGVVYHAGNFIELLPNFETDFGAQFSAYIEGCSNNFVYRPTNETKSKEVVIDNRIMNGKDGLFIYPNPTSHIVELKSALNFKKVMLYSTEGRVVFERDIEKTDAYQIDVSSFANGLYMINVVYENGEMVSQKLIKN